MTYAHAAILVASVAAACTATPASDPAALRAELLERDRAFSQVTAERGVEGWIAFFADSGAMIQRGVGEIRGIDAIREAAAAMFDAADASLTWEPIRADVAASGDLGYTVGHYRYTAPGPGGGPVSQGGLYVTIWKRDATGAWEVVMDLGNPVDES